MATNHTAYYGLCQWEPEDNFIRTEFNADNLKVDTELKRVDAMAQESHRALPLVTYNVYNLVLQNYYESKVTTYRRGLLFDGFVDDYLISDMAGGVTQSDNSLHLTGAGAVGTMTGLTLGVYGVWKKAICWVRHNGGNVTPALNGHPMTFNDFHQSTTFQGVSCTEDQFILEEDGESHVTFSLELRCETAPSMTVYDYGVIFF